MTRLTGKALEERERQRKENLLLDLYVLDQASTGRSRSLVDIRSLDIHSVTISEDILTEVVGMAAMDQSQVKKRTCHQCHAPTSDPCHDGVPSGVGVCPLQHWGLCTGGIKTRAVRVGLAAQIQRRLMTLTHLLKVLCPRLAWGAVGMRLRGTLLLRIWQEDPGRRGRRESAYPGTNARLGVNASGRLIMRGRNASMSTSALIARPRS